MRLKEIETRLAEIRKELTENAETLTDEQITALETEVDNLQEERTRLVDAQEKRTKLLARIAGGEPVNGAEGGAGAAPTVLRNLDRKSVV